MNKVLTYIFVFLFSVCLVGETISQVKTNKQQTEDPKKSQLASQYYRSQEYEKAAALYEQLYESNPTHVNYTYLLYSLVQIQEFKKAEKIVKKQSKRYPNKPKYLVDLGYIYFSSDESAKAKKYFDQALNSLQPDKHAIIELANAFLSKRESEYAIRTYLKGRQMLNYTYPFHLELARIYKQNQKYEQMFNEYLDLIMFDETQIGTVQNKLQTLLGEDPDDTINDIFRYTLLKRVQKFPENPFYSEMLLWYSVQRKDFETALLQAKALDRRFNEDGLRVYDLALLSTSNKDYDVAIQAYNYIIRKGTSNFLYINSRVELLNVTLLKITGSYDNTYEDLLKLESDYITTLEEFGESSMTLSLIRYLAHLHAFYLEKTPEAIGGLSNAIAMPNISKQQRAECKLELADILLFSGEPWEATLLYSQVEKDFKHDPIGHEAKFRNAKLTYYIGEFGWAKAQLDVLKAATSKLIANDAMALSLLISDNMDPDSTYKALSMFAKADLLMYRNKDDEALMVLDSVTLDYTYHPIADEVLFKKAEILLKNGRYDEADTLLSQVVEIFPYEILADNALFERAKLHDHYYNDPTMAMDLYQELLTSYPGSLFAVEARKRFRELRGDEL